MWIQTQNKLRIINSDQVIDIFVDKSGTKIMAEITRDGDFFTLGEYKDRDTCLGVLEHITIGMGSKIPGIPMPLGGEVETWKEGIDKMAAINVANTLLMSL